MSLAFKKKSIEKLKKRGNIFFEKEHHHHHDDRIIILAVCLYFVTGARGVHRPAGDSKPRTGGEGGGAPHGRLRGQDKLHEGWQRRPEGEGVSLFFF